MHFISCVMGNRKTKKKRRTANALAAGEEKEELEFLKKGDRVKHQFPGYLHTRPESGIVRFVGYPKTNGELMAGIEFDDYIYRYGTYGALNGVTYFKCQYGHGSFIPVQTILEENPEFLQKREIQFLKLGDKIKCKISKRLYGDPEVGTIIYIGYPEATAELMAGIQFDHYVGNGHYGRSFHFKGAILFECPNGYGELISVKTILEENPEFEINMEQFRPSSENCSTDTPPDLNPNQAVSLSGHENGDTKNSETISEPRSTYSVQKEGSSGVKPQNEHLSKAEMLKPGCHVIFLPTPNAEPIPGVVKWIGDLDGVPHGGIEFEKPVGVDHLLKKHAQLFHCKDRYGILKPIRRIMSDRKLKILGCGAPETTISSMKQGFDLISPTEFICPPVCLDDFINYRGNKGIQGRTNSCYLDSTLFSMFAFTQVFDSSLLGNKCSNIFSKTEDDLAEQTQILLGKYIVNPLRSEHFCPAEPILQLRRLMLPLNSKLESSYMDAEEFMFLLFEKVFKLQGFLTYDNGVSDFLHQIDTSDLKSRAQIISTQRLLEVSMKSLGMKFMTAPNPALILQMPRSGGKLVGRLKAIIPTLTLDLTNLIQGGQRKCWICGQDATVECLDCFDTTHESGMDSTSYCWECIMRSHLHPHRANHQTGRRIEVRGLQSEKQVADLVAVICVSACHFVSFARAGSGAWVFCDSNPTGKFPMTEVLPGFDDWLKDMTSMTEAELVHKWDRVNSYLKRILTDSHICIYSPRIFEAPVLYPDSETSL